MPSDETSLAEVQLLLAIVRRDERAFADLYDRLSRPVFSMIVRILRSTAEAEEVLQETFWQVWERAPSYRAELGSPFCWVVTIARRRAIDRLRANARHRVRLEEAQASQVEEDSPAGGDEKLAASEQAAVVRAALASLRPEERQAIELAFFDGHTHAEIAEALAIPVGTVKARVRRGMLKLQTPLESLRRARANQP